MRKIDHGIEAKIVLQALPVLFVVLVLAADLNRCRIQMQDF
jgi:hypothetical protein